MELIDTHCHLDTATEDELSAIFLNADRVGVERMICIGASKGIESSPAAVALARKHTRIYATVGIHPHDAGSYTDLTPLLPLLDDPKVVALGETGLDFFRDWAPKEAQYALFKNTIALAKKRKKPLVIHCRDAYEETYRVLVEEGAAEVGGVFHCYAGDAEYARKIIDLNFLISFTGALTFKKSDNLKAVVRDIPLEKIMCETDTPYMAPEPFRGGKSEPMHVYQVARAMAEIKGLTLEQVAEITTANAERLFQLGR
jgi:TatD DNase family protein